MNILLNFIQSFFGSAGLVVGLFALFGSILLRRTILQTVVSTFTTVLGFFILSLGGGAIGTAMTDFKNMFGIIVGAGSSGTVAASDAFAIAMMNNAANIAAVTSIMLLLSILFNLLLAGTTRFKNIYLSTHIVMYFCVGFTAMYMLCTPNGVSDIALGKQGLIIAVIGAALIAIYTTLAPSLTSKVTYDLMKDKSLNLCHHGLFCFSLAQAVGKLCGKAQKGKYTSTENMHLPRWMSFLRNSNVTIILVMTLLFVIVFVTAYIMNPSGASNQISSSPTALKSLGVVLVVDAFTFTAGLLVLIEGITMMVNELRECIKGVSQRFIVGAKMSVDASLILKTQPIAVLLGFLASFVGAIVTMGISFAFHAMDGSLFSSIILPSVVVFFFLGGTAGIFGNMRGGLLGCLMAGFIIGLVVSFLPIILIAT
jgi:PTS system ascorbate-specific IIC component